jgi:mono/diheme cytochrome c family protein
MKPRFLFLFLAVLFALSACNFSLAEDITPPPNYASPTPLPDLGLLYPSQPPSPARGAEIFSSKCAPCHGDEGLGNGPMANSLPVAVPAIGLVEISRQAVPAEWYKIISLGNIQRGMPPFIAHPATERWDVLAYTLMLGTTAEEIARGSELYAAQCASCHQPGGAGSNVDFSNQEYMAQKSGAALYQAIAKGNGVMPAFDQQLSEEDIWAVVAYLRTLSFDMSSLATPTPESTPVPTATLQAAAVETPLGVAETTPEALATPVAETTLEVEGTVVASTPTVSFDALTVNLVFYDLSMHQAVDSITQTVASDGFYRFTNIPANPSWAYWVTVDYQQVTYYSQPAYYQEGVTSMSLPVKIYESNTDWNGLTQDVLHVILDFSIPGMLQVTELFVLNNKTAETVILNTDGTYIDFIRPPEGALNFALRPDENSAPFFPAEGGIALLPSELNQYGIVASFSLPYERKVEFSQEILLPVTSVSLFTIDGTKLKSDQLMDGGTQQVGEKVYRLYQGTNLQPGVLQFTASPPSNTFDFLSSNTPIVLGVGALGLIFLILGVVLFLRDRALQKGEEESDENAPEEEDALGDDPEAISDAILLLDEKFRQGEISREVYEKRRSELKDRLKSLL